MTTPVLALKDIVVGHPSAPRLGPVSLEIQVGEALALLGPNGAGKSTLLRAIVGLEDLASGQIAVEGDAVRAWSALRAARAGIGYAPEGRRPFPGLTAEENLLSVADVGRQERDGRLADIYSLFPQLVRRRRAEAWRLSGGEQQMLAIGRALMRRPRLLLLDEPSLGLAPKVLSELFAAIAEIKARGVTILLAEQTVGEALAIADRAAFLSAGGIVASGPADAYTDYEMLASRYLG